MLSRLYAVSSGLFVLISRVITASDSHLSLHCQTTCRAALYAGNLFHYFLLSANLFIFNIFFQKLISRILSECQTFWIQLRPEILSGLIKVQSVCKGYQQTILTAE